MLDRLRHRLLEGGGRWVCRRPVMVLVLAAIVAAAAVAVTARSLTFQADRNDLLSADLEWNQRFIEYLHRFAGHDSLIAAVKVPQGEAGPGQARRFADGLAERLQDDTEHFKRVWHRFEPSPILLRLAPMSEFEQRLDQIAQSEPLLRADGASDLLGRITSEFTRRSNPAGGDGAPADTPDPDEALQQIEQLITLVEAVDRGVAGELDESHLAALGADEEDRWQYLESDDGELLFVQIEARPMAGELDPFEESVAAARRAMEGQRREMPGIEAGLTGILVMEADESRVLMADSALASIVAVSAIGVLLIMSFRGWRMPVWMVLALAAGVAWSFGFLTLAIGHLQLLSVFFTVILLGLGIDFGIHLVSAFERTRPRHGPGRAGCEAAVMDALHTAGPGILTGAVTTAVAFGTTMLTDFQGMAEMGLIAGAGVLLCMAAMLTILPALIVLRNARPGSAAPPVPAIGPDAHRQGWVMLMVRHPWRTIAVAGLATTIAAVAMTRVRYDTNLMDLYPEGLSSVAWQQEILEHSREAVWSAASTTDDLDEARERTLRFRDKPTVKSVGGIGLLFPPNESEKRDRIQETRDRLGDALDPPEETSPGTAGALRQRLQGLGLLLSFAMNREDVRGEPEIYAALQRLSATVREALERMNSESFRDNAEQRMAELHGLFTQWRRGVREEVEAALSTRDLTPADLPQFLRHRSISVTEPTRYLLEIYPAQDVWEDRYMRAFITDLREVDAAVTGVPVQIYESGELIQRSYQYAGVLASVAVLILVWLDFRSPANALLCMLPVAFGFVTMFGIMWLFGVSINPANIIVLPLLFGIGVASGVHMMHRFRQSPLDLPPGLSAGTGKGILLTSATTVIAFASLLLARHRGIQSLGFVLAVGIAMTLVACVTVMPAVLALRGRPRHDKE